IVVLGLAASSLVAASVTPADAVLLRGWSQARYGAAHNADNRFETTLSPSKVSSLHKVWSVTVSRPDWVLESNIAIAPGRAFLATWDHHIFAVDAASGRKLWSRPLPVGLMGTAPVDDTRIYVWTGDDTLRAFRQRDGAPLWHVHEGNGGGAP